MPVIIKARLFVPLNTIFNSSRLDNLNLVDYERCLLSKLGKQCEIRVQLKNNRARISNSLPDFDSRHISMSTGFGLPNQE